MSRTYATTNSGGGTGSSDISVVTQSVLGLINSSNTAYTVANPIGSPISLILANAFYENGVDYTFSGTNLTMTVAPDSSLSGQPFFLVNTTVGSATVYTDAVGGTIDGSNTAFTVSHTIKAAIALILANSYYQPSVDYTYSGTSITMTVAPDSSLSGQPFFLVHI